MGEYNCPDAGLCFCNCNQMVSDCKHEVIHCYNHDNGCHMNCKLPVKAA